MSSKPFYSDTFKADAVDLVVSSGRSVTRIAAELGIGVTTLHKWVKDARRDGTAGNTNGDEPVDMAKYQALLAQNRELQREVEFLGKVSLNSIPQCNTSSHASAGVL